jgi:hypothetical protein
MRKLYGMDERIAEPAMGKPLGPRQFWAVAGCMPVAVVGLIWLALGLAP